MEKEKKQLNLGLDIGTNSVGWALLDENLKLIKKNNFTFWGVRMFEEASDAKDTRTSRNSRRRLARRKNRIKMLQDIFAPEIYKEDPNFYMKLEDSFYKKEDKRDNEIYDGSYGLIKYNYKDKNIDENDPGYIFYKKCPTIFHLRKYLLESNKKEDIRLIYLALHNLIKYRGNFLTPGDEFKSNDIETIKEVFENFNKLNDELINNADENNEETSYNEYFVKIEVQFDELFFNNIEKIINDKTTNKTEKKAKLLELFNVPKSSLANEYLIPLLVGSNVIISNLKPIKNNKYDKADVSLDVDDLQKIIDENISKVPEYELLFTFLFEVKKVTDYYYLKGLLKGNNEYLCQAMVDKYNEHQKDLKDLKRIIKTYAKDEYYNVFRKYDVNLKNYVLYIGRNNTKNKTERFNHCKREDFYKFLKPILENINKMPNVVVKDKTIIDNFIRKIDNDDFLLRQASNKNGTLPHQLGLKEIKDILNKQKEYYPFLKEKDSNGLSNLDKIMSIFKFKIPYYVGPLITNEQSNNNEYSKNSWMVKNKGMENTKITPWNFDKVVDTTKTAENFINRMQNKCTYLKGDNDYCLPKSSMIFSEYNCLSYLNKIKINGQSLSLDIKMNIFDNVFKKKRKPTKKDILDYLKLNYGDLLSLSTTKGKELPEVECDMASYYDLSNYLGEEIVKTHFDECEEIIKYITLFEDKDILVTKLEQYSFLTKDNIKSLKGLNYKKWSSLCKNLLVGLYYDVDELGEVKHKNILQIMRETNLNLNEILYSDVYKFNEKIDEYNKNNVVDDDVTLESYMDEYVTVSPIMHRPLTQAINIIKEIETIFDRPIDNYYIECNRTNKADKKTSKSRYERLKELYKELEKDTKEYNEITEQLKKFEGNQNALQSDKIYLYFTQLGRSIYTGKPINLADVISGNGYDIDHIYPQALIKDDSLSNRVLVEKDFNNKKSDKFLYETNIDISYMQKNLWDILLKKDLITKEKYRRLTTKEIKPEELEGFYTRQIVATNQAEKALADILKNYYGVDPTHIIYSKAENVSAFRLENGLVKSREANNYHHAHDAYLNVVVGSVLNKYYHKLGVSNLNDYDKIKNLGLSLNPIKILRYNRTLNGNVIANIESYKAKSNKGDDFKLLWNCDLELGKPTSFEEKYEKEVDDNGEVKVRQIPVHSYFDDASENNGRIYYDLYKRYDIHETVRCYNSANMFAKVTIAKAGNGAVSQKNDVDPRSNIDNYGGYLSASYSRFVVVKCVDKKGNVENKLLPIPRMNDDINENIARIKIVNYLNINLQKYKSFEVIVWNIKKNCICIKGKTQSYITGTSSGSYLLMNKIDRNFDYNTICAIKKLEKYRNLVGKKEMRKKDDNTIVLSEAKNDNNKEIILSKVELYLIIEAQLANFKKEIYAFSSMDKIKMFVLDDFKKFSFEDIIYLTIEFVKYIKTNERKDIDLKLLGLSQHFGVLMLGSNLKNCKLITESVTGYYKKVLFED